MAVARSDPKAPKDTTRLPGPYVSSEMRALSRAIDRGAVRTISGLLAKASVPCPLNRSYIPFEPGTCGRRQSGATGLHDKSANNPARLLPDD